MLSFIQGAVRLQRDRSPRRLSLAGGGFRQKVPLDVTLGRFQIKTVATKEELQAVLALRKEVFHFEFAKKRFSFRSDRDLYDDAGDLLFIRDLERDLVVGTYRLIASDRSDTFYSSTEYWIEGLLTLPGTKLELSRACIHRDYRNGSTIRLLWKGIAAYAQATGAEYLFGLSSVTTTDARAIVAMYRAMQKDGLVDLSFNVIPRPRYAIKDLPRLYAEQHHHGVVPDDEVADMIPPLLKSYFKAGAKICSHPVIDPEFKCADFITILPMASLHPSYARKFMGSSAPRDEA